MMQPKSLAILGISSKAGSVGQQVLRNLQANGFDGCIHLVGRSAGEIAGLPVVGSVDELPVGIDLAVLAVPAAAVGETLSQCIARKVATAVVFASGFAETGPEARAEQERIGRMVRAAGMSVLGPNCLGFINFISGLRIIFTSVEKTPLLPHGTRDAVAIVAQSGGVQSHVYRSLVARGIAVSYSITTGNEMDLGAADAVRYLLGDEATRTVAIYAEHIGDAAGFLESARLARELGKSLVLLHPGRSGKAREAAQSHTGSLVSNYAVMRARLQREGVMFVDSLDEFVDMSELITRHPRPRGGGVGIITFSGAFCGISHDVCDELAIPVPALGDETAAVLRAVLPAYIQPANPLDLGTQVLFQPQLLHIGVKALMEDESIGALLVSIPLSSAEQAVEALRCVVSGLRDAPSKPFVLLMMNDTAPLPPEFVADVAAESLVISRSADRAIRSLGKMLRLGDLLSRPLQPHVGSGPLSEPLRPGAQAEWQGKRLLAAAGIRVPEGNLAKSLEQARTIARQIGFPVAVKAQSEALTHKTEAGAVLLGIGDLASLDAAWARLHDNVQQALGGAVSLDGVLVERMEAAGLELIVGGKRDSQWGPMILVGIGGVLVEALQDVRLVTPEASVEEIESELRQLKGARLLAGFRNSPPVDVNAAAGVVRSVARLMTAHPEITEIDVNPLRVHARGGGATALDALVVVADT